MKVFLVFILFFASFSAIPSFATEINNGVYIESGSFDLNTDLEELLLDLQEVEGDDEFDLEMNHTIEVQRINNVFLILIDPIASRDLLIHTPPPKF